MLVDGRGWAERKSGTWVGPTVIVKSRNGSNGDGDGKPEEIFGPVLMVVKVFTARGSIHGKAFVDEKLLSKPVVWRDDLFKHFQTFFCFLFALSFTDCLVLDYTAGIAVGNSFGRVDGKTRLRR